MNDQNGENNQHGIALYRMFKVFSREDAFNEHMHKEHGWPRAKRPAATQKGGVAAKRQKV